MTIPKSNDLPKQKNFESSEEVNKYVSTLVGKLEKQYEDLAAGINGQTKSSYQVQQENWTPILKGTNVAGSPTYTRQKGFSFRQGLITDIWADIIWTASGGAAGSIYIELPYKVAITDGFPFVASAQLAGITFDPGYTEGFVNAISGTYRLEIWEKGSNIAMIPILFPNFGQILCHIRYMGVQDER